MYRQSELRAKTLTVSVACYNVEQFLERTLKSLIIDSKYMKMMEVFIVDDGSKDGTEAIAQEYCKQYPDTFQVIAKENGGYGSTVNASLKRAAGKYFKLLDGDDWYQTENISMFLDFLQNADSDLILSPYYYVRNENKILADTHSEIDSNSLKISSHNFQCDILMHELTVKTKSLQNNNVALSEKCFYTDNEFVFFSIFNAKTISRFDKPVYCYRIGDINQSVSISGERRHYLDNVKVAKKIYPEFEKIPNDSNRELLKMKIKLVTNNVYSAFMVLENPEKYKLELKKFDFYIKYHYPKIYDLTMEIPKVKVLRFVNFFFYRPLCKQVLRNTLKSMCQ